jgi:serine/threonine protein kinase
MSAAPVKADESVESLVGQVADEFLRRQRDGERPDVEEYIARYPQAAEVLRPVLTSLGLLDFSQQGRSPSSTETGPNEVAGTLGDFRILGEIGRGGMGVVYEAEQISLSRRVALKVLPFASTLDAKQLQRFKNEAQAAAHLHHQSIVPVYATGCERGVHYYAMQFIEGRTLAAVIEELRTQAQWQRPTRGVQTTPWEKGKEMLAELAPAPKSPADDSWATAPGAVTRSRPDEAATLTSPPGFSTETSTKDPAFFLAAARLGIQAAQALEHAHQLGVVHRDIKPANLLVEGRGNLWITDFGLAQVQSNASLTLTGDLVGTVRYMSPEQTLAKRVLLDHRTDVYSLGVTLYELLTLEPAFNGRNRHEVVHQIAFDEPRRPRQINKAVPAELETIVLKAMEKNPAERYATAQEMADDLERFLKDEPIRAKRPGLLLRARKWARRHPAVSWSALILVFLATTAVAMFSWREKHWSDRRLADKVEEQQITQAALAQAEKARRHARGALDELCSEEILSDWLGRQKQLTAMQRGFLDRALESYQRFTEDIGDSPEQRQALAGAHYHIGVIREKLGQWKEAQESYRHAIDRLVPLVRDYPDAPEFAQDLARCHNDLAVSQGRSGQREAAIQSLEAARSQRAALVQKHPGVPEFARDLAHTYINLGVEQARHGDTETSILSNQAAIALLGDLVRDHPKLRNYRSDLAVAYQNLGIDRMRLNRTKEALESYQAALALQNELVRENPQSRAYQREAASTYFSLGELQRRMGQRDAALESQERSRTLRAALVRDYPGVPEYVEDLADAHNNLGILLGDMGRREAALESYEAARALFAALMRDHPDVPRFAVGLGGIYCNLGALVRETGRPDAGLELFDKAISVLEAVLKKEPRFFLAREFLHNSHRERIRTLEQKGRLAEAIQEWEKFAAEFPGRLDSVQLGGDYCNFGKLLTDQGKPTEALHWFAKAIETLEGVLKKDARAARARQFLRNSHWNRAGALDHLNRFAEAVKDWDRALELDDGSARIELRVLRAISQLRAGDPARAVAEANALADLKEANGTTVYNMACIVSLASAAVKQDSGLKERYATRAVELLQKAESSGYFKDSKNIELLKKDPDLDPIRSREDFKKLEGRLTPKGTDSP